MEVLLKALDIKFERERANLIAKCPNPDHVDTNPSWTMVNSPGTWKHGGHRCFSCGFGGGPWELVMAVRGVDEEGAKDFVGALVTGNPRVFAGVPRVRVSTKPARREYELPGTVNIPSLDGSEWPEPFAAYLERRGVTEEQTVRWHLGWATRGSLAWRIVIPVHTRGRLVAHVGRAIFDDRERYDMPRSAAVGARPSAALFGEPLLDAELRVLTIAEGSFSKLKLELAGAPNTVALLGSDWNVDKATILTSVQWDAVIIATDPDPAGDRVAREIAVAFRKAKNLRLRMTKSPDDCGLDEIRSSLRQLGVSQLQPQFH